MAGCSSSSNGIVPLKLFSSSSSFSITKLGCFSRTNTRLLYKIQRPRLVVVNVMNTKTEVTSTVEKDAVVVDDNYFQHDIKKNGGGDDCGSGGNGKSPGGGGGGGDDGEDYEEKEFGPILKFEEVIRESEARGASLPADMLEAAKTEGLRKVLLLRYLDLQGSLGFLMRSSAMLRNRMLADPSFLFKIGAEIVIDSCCTTFAEVKKRGKEFWAEFELFTADLLVGVVVNVALVGMLAPYARIGGPSAASQGIVGRLRTGYASLPSSVFEADRPGTRYSVKQRITTFFCKGIVYGFVGFGCGLIGQGIANLIMTAKRKMRKREDGDGDEIPVPPLIKSAAVWGVFLGVSGNTRYQIINGLERMVEASAVGKRVPAVAMGFTVGLRFLNNVYGGMQFVDWARLAGAQ